MTLNRIFHIGKVAGAMTLLLAAASCANEDIFEPGFTYGPSFSLQVVTSENDVTRTDGDDALNENRFVSLDYYFFASNNDALPMLLHKSEGTRLATGNNTLDISEHIYNATMTDNDVTAIFGENAVAGRQCYVYVLANLDETTRATINAMSSPTMEQIKTVSFQDTGISANARQECFVMYGGGLATLTIDDATGVRTLGGPAIRVTRDAAKVVLTVTEVKDTVHVADPLNEDQHQVWKSDTEHMYVMFFNGVNKSNVHSQINTGRHYVPTDGDNCYFDLTAKNNGWRVLTPSNGVEPNKNLSHDYPFYTYLADWREDMEEAGADLDHPSYMILVVPWKQIDEEGNDVGGLGFRNTYYQVETTTSQTYYENVFYHINLKVGVLGSFELPEPVELQCTYMIVPWGEKTVDASLREPVYLIVEKDSVRINNAAAGYDPYISSHPVTAKVTQVKFIDYSRKPYVSVTLTGNQTRNITYNGRQYTVRLSDFTVNPTDGNIVLTHNIPVYMFQSYEVTVEVTMPYDNNTKTQTETIVYTQYPPIYITTVAENTNRYVFVNGTNNSDDRDYIWTRNNRPRTWLGSLTYRGNAASFTSTQSNTNPYIYEISISSLSEAEDGFEYMLGDPRDAAQTINNNGLVINNYRPGKESAEDQYVIAPKFIIASSYGKTSYPDDYYNDGGMTWEKAKLRCASYQENGYPAGRWRLPTFAEVRYIMQLSAQGSIPSLFLMGTNDDTGYWCSNGRIYTRNGNTLLGAKTGDPTAPRCVYDTWYWGSEPVNAYMQTWSGFQTN